MRLWEAVKGVATRSHPETSTPAELAGPETCREVAHCAGGYVRRTSFILFISAYRRRMIVTIIHTIGDTSMGPMHPGCTTRRGVPEVTAKQPLVWHTVQYLFGQPTTQG